MTTEAPDRQDGQDRQHGLVRDELDLTREVTNSRRVYEGAIFDLVRDEVRLRPDQEPLVRDYLRHPGAVGVLALRGEPGAEEAVVVRQYRHPVRARLWEIPAGLRDVEGEPPHETAARELREEADLTADTWNVLAEVVNSPGSTSEGLRIYLARDVQEVDPFERSEEEAEMEHAWVPLDDLVDGVLAGHLHNPTLATGVLAAVAARARGWEGLRPADAAWEIDGHDGN